MTELTRLQWLRGHTDLVCLAAWLHPFPRGFLLALENVFLFRESTSPGDWMEEQIASCFLGPRGNPIN